MKSPLIHGTYGLFVREMKKWLRQKPQIIFAFVIPVVWLLLFGKSFNLTYLLNVPLDVPPEVRAVIQRAMEQALLRVFGSLDYFNFFAVGMLSAFALFTSMWSGMSLVWDRRLGYLERMLAAPIPRVSIYLAKVLSTLAKGLLQFSFMLLFVFVVGFTPKQGITIMDILAVYAVMASLILALAAIFTAIAIRITSHDLVISIANLVNLPLLFTSNAIFPLRQMPDWLKLAASLNPLTHSTSLSRYFLLGIGSPSPLQIHAGYMILFTLACIAVGSMVASRYL